MRTQVIDAPQVEPASSPVFVDSTGRRARLAKRTAWTVALCCLGYLAVFGVSLASGPVSPLVPVGRFPEAIPAAAGPVKTTPSPKVLVRARPAKVPSRPATTPAPAAPVAPTVTPAPTAPVTTAPPTPTSSAVPPTTESPAPTTSAEPTGSSTSTPAPTSTDSAEAQSGADAAGPTLGGAA